MRGCYALAERGKKTVVQVCARWFLTCSEDLLRIIYYPNKNAVTKNTLLLTSYWRRGSCSFEWCEPTCMPVTVAQVGGFMCLHRELQQSERVTGELCSDGARGVKFCQKLSSMRASRPAV
ncbi:hypothetical protein NDU88_006642 [Pleurodeles waltl]|uniref:Uncharacterized protein n=1 Tax=Pleurodeles waltl TaxID=8319 RepID=A0AAV7NSJ9_PLEWA|nr:hypothetical protein NDU88_006642 [Pleurodeles waltl]